MKWKNRIWKRMIIGGGAVFLLASARSGIYAAEKDGAAVELSVHQTVYEEETSEELEGLFEYDLTALEEGSPMPDDSQNNIYSFSMSGTENRKIGPMIFSHGGIYRYEVKQNISGKKENYRYDETVYTVEVYVKNEEHGLTAEVIVLNEAGSKCESIQFENTYTVPGTEMTPAPFPNVTPGAVPAVRTGDTNSLGMYVILLGLAVLMMGAVISEGRNAKC